jgi:hypothetical protein
MLEILWQVKRVIAFQENHFFMELTIILARIKHVEILCAVILSVGIQRRRFKAYTLYVGKYGISLS